MTDPIRPTDDEARSLARALMSGARFCALATLDTTGAPQTARVALSNDPESGPVSLVSTLSQHTQALLADPRASLLVGEPGEKGDPLTHPRVTLQASAAPVRRTDPDFAGLRARWLETHPKSKLYIDFGDFLFLRFKVDAAFLNGGFGKAFTLTPSDLGLTG